MIGPFEELLEELGKVLKLPLHPDHHLACCIQTPHLAVQLQPDAAMEKLILFAKIIEIPPGKFRENVLREALKVNALPDPRPGVLCYHAPTNQLALFQNYPFSILSGERLSGIFGAFLDTAVSWRKAIESGQSAPLRT